MTEFTPVTKRRPTLRGDQIPVPTELRRRGGVVGRPRPVLLFGAVERPANTLPNRRH
jgi:hypothetical protein